MPLSESECNKLSKVWDTQLLNLFWDYTDQVRWSGSKDKLLVFCEQNNVLLYNIVESPTAEAKEMLISLMDALDADVVSDGIDTLLLWKEQFDKLMSENSRKALQLHNSAYLSVSDQWARTGEIKDDTLLTLTDMQLLIKDRNNRVKSFTPFSLTEYGPFMIERLKTFLSRSARDAVSITFLPITHQGHWFYLKKERSVWSLHDSFPIGDDYTPRQFSMLEGSMALLNALSEVVEDIEFSGGSQENNYECGTHVVNAYRSLVDSDYNPLSHKAILNELAAIPEAHMDDSHLDQAQKSNYSFQLKMGIGLASVLSLAAFVVAALAFTAVISNPILGGIALGVGLIAAGVAVYGLFKVNKDSPRVGCNDLFYDEGEFSLLIHDKKHI